jgi:TrkA-C domain.
VLPTVGIGGLLGVGLSQVLHTDPAVAGLIGAVAFLTVTLNVPLGATLLAVAWGGDTMLPLALLAAGLAHAISGEPGIIPGQLRSRADSALPAPASGLALPNTVRALPRRPVQTAGTPYLPDTGIDQNGRQLYRRPVPSNWRGAKLKLLALPPAVEVVGVLRGGAVQLPRPELRLTDGDELIFLAQPEAYASLENMLRLPGA